ncbi:hypothetical protein SRHO_G00077790, partial [Serrasalmus rhombeus]
MTIVNFSRANETCSLQGESADPQLSKDGHIIIGGIFPFHSNWEISDLSYTVKPNPPKCR